MKKITKTRHNPSIIKYFECKIPKYKIGNPCGKWVEKSQKLGIIQSVLQNLDEKFQNTKIGTTFYSVCVLTGLRNRAV